MYSVKTTCAFNFSTSVQSVLIKKYKTNLAQDYDKLILLTLSLNCKIWRPVYKFDNETDGKHTGTYILWEKEVEKL